MAVIFDYTAQLRNAYLLSSASSEGLYISKSITSPGTFVELFRCLYNPGHQNNSSVFEYYLLPTFRYINTTQAIFYETNVKWEFKSRDSTAWNKFSTGTISQTTSVDIYHSRRGTGSYDSSAVALPMSIKMSAKISTTNLGYVNSYISNQTSNMCAIRAWGPVST